MKYITDTKELDFYIKKAQASSLFQSDLSHHMQLVFFDKKEYVYHQGEELDGLFIFLSGEINVYYSLTNGKDTILRTINKPRIAGEIELLLSCPAATTIQAVKATYAIYLSHAKCRRLLENDVVFLKNISRNLAEALYTSNNNASINQHFSPKSRIASFILSTEQDGKFHCNFKVLPGLTGMSDRHIFRILNEFIQMKLIEKKGREYFITDFRALEDIAGDNYLP